MANNQEPAKFRGVVVSYPEKNAGFGFIKPTGENKDMEEIFFHKTALKSENIIKGSSVVFELGNHPKNTKGVVALNVELVS